LYGVASGRSVFAVKEQVFNHRLINDVQLVLSHSFLRLHPHSHVPQFIPGHQPQPPIDLLLVHSSPFHVLSILVPLPTSVVPHNLLLVSRFFSHGELCLSSHHHSRLQCHSSLFDVHSLSPFQPISAYLFPLQSRSIAIGSNSSLASS